MQLRRIALLALTTCALPHLASAQIDLAVTANPDPVRPGEMTEVVLRVSNIGAVAQMNLSVELDYPAGLSSTSEVIITDAGDCIGAGFVTSCEAGELLRWNIGTLQPAQAVRLSLPPIVAAATANGTVITFVARVLQGAITLDQDQATATVSTAPVLDLAIDASASPVPPGSELEYTLSFGNESTATAANLTLRLPLPAGVVFLSANDSGVLNGNTVEWNVASLAPGRSTTRRARVQVGALADGTFLRVAGAEVVPAGAPASAARASQVARVLADSPLALAVVANPDPARPTEMVEVELTASNRSASTLFDVAVLLRYPIGLASVPELLGTGSPDCIGAGFVTSCEGSEYVVWALGQIAPGRGVTVVLPPTLAAAVVGASALTFAARATATGGALAEASASVLAASAPRFDLALLAGADPALPGEAVEYTVMFGNESTTTALAAVLEFPLPRGATYVSSSNAGALVGDTVTWALGDLPPRAGDVRRATVSIPAGTAAGTLLTGPAARLRDTVSPAEEARATALARVQSARALVVDVAASPDPAKPNEQTSIEVTAANRGNLAISDIVVDLRVPMEVASTAETIIEGAGDCIGAGFVTSCEAGEYLTWPVGSLQPGESRTVAYPARIAVGGFASGGSVMTASVDARATGGLAASGGTVLLVDDLPVLDLVLDTSRNPAVPGQIFDLVYSFGNEGAVTRNLRLEVPLVGTLLSTSNGGKATGGVVGWDVAGVTTGQGGERRMQVQLGGSAGWQEFPPARLFDRAAPFEVARASQLIQVEQSPSLRLSGTGTPDPAAQGALLDIDFQLENLTAAPLLSVVAQVRMPDQLNSLAETAFTPSPTECLGAGFLSSCEPQEIANWALGQINSAATQVVGLPPVVANAAVLGTYIRFRGRVFDSLGGDALATRSIRVGALMDTDGDTVGQFDDNCPTFANPNQADTDLDGRGDLCECGDQNGDGQNTVSDLVAINVAIFNPALITPLCDANNDAFCDVNDIIAVNNEIFSPTSTSTCARQPVPGP